MSKLPTTLEMFNKVDAFETAVVLAKGADFNSISADAHFRLKIELKSMIQKLSIAAEAASPSLRDEIAMRMPEWTGLEQPEVELILGRPLAARGSMQFLRDAAELSAKLRYLDADAMLAARGGV